MEPSDPEPVLEEGYSWAPRELKASSSSMGLEMACSSSMPPMKPSWPHRGLSSTEWPSGEGLHRGLSCMESPRGDRLQRGLPRTESSSGEGGP